MLPEHFTMTRVTSLSVGLIKAVRKLQPDMERNYRKGHADYEVELEEARLVILNALYEDQFQDDAVMVAAWNVLQGVERI